MTVFKIQWKNSRRSLEGEKAHQEVLQELRQEKGPEHRGSKKKGMGERDFTKEGSSEMGGWILNLCFQEKKNSCVLILLLGGPFPTSP